MLKVQGGYRCITVAEISNLVAAKQARLISFAAVKAYLGAHLLVASRCATRRTRSFTLEELTSRLGERKRISKIKAAIRELEETGLIRWSERAIRFRPSVLPIAHELASELKTAPQRPVPVPRYILRRLVRHTKASEVIVALIHLARCLFKRGQKIVSEGFVNAEWASVVTGLSRRAIHNTRAWLHREGVLETLSVKQWVLNRYGARFRVLLTHNRAPKQKSARPKNAGPYMISSLNPKSTSLNQYNKPAHGNRAGVCTTGVLEPNIRNVQREDLRTMSRLEKLYRQAVKANWLPHSEANIRNFVCSALRATRAGGRVGAIFAGIVKQKLWHHVTQAEEDQALRVLRRYRERRMCAFQPDAGDSTASDRQTTSFQSVTRVLQPSTGLVRTSAEGLMRVGNLLKLPGLFLQPHTAQESFASSEPGPEYRLSIHRLDHSIRTVPASISGPTFVGPSTTVIRYTVSPSVGGGDSPQS